MQPYGEQRKDCSNYSRRVADAPAQQMIDLRSSGAGALDEQSLEAIDALVTETINVLFGIGLHLSATISFEQGESRVRLREAITELDELIADLRLRYMTARGGWVA